MLAHVHIGNVHAHGPDMTFLAEDACQRVTLVAEKVCKLFCCGDYFADDVSQSLTVGDAHCLPGVLLLAGDLGDQQFDGVGQGRHPPLMEDVLSV